jgi:hypothetical protein
MSKRARLVAGSVRLLVSGIVVLSLFGPSPIHAQGQPNDALYYGAAVTADGKNLPVGTEITAVVANGPNDTVTIETAGEYGSAGFGGETLEVPTDSSVSFIAENEYGRFEANRSIDNPQSGKQRLDLGFPPGSAERRPYFRVSGLDPQDTTVFEDETANVTATVANVGSEAGTQTVSLTLDGQSVGTQEVTLDPDEQTTVRFTVDASQFQPGDYTHELSTADTAQSGSLTIEDTSAVFEVTAFDPSDPTVVQGESYNVTATVENTGNTDGTQPIEYRVDGATRASESVTLDAGETYSFEASGISTSGLSNGSYTHEVVTANDSRSGTLTIITENPWFSVSSMTGQDQVVRGTSLNTSATIVNDGADAGVQTVTLRFTTSLVDEQTVNLSVDEERTLTFANVSTADLATGRYAYTVATANESQTGTVTVVDEANDTTGTPTGTVRSGGTAADADTATGTAPPTGSTPSVTAQPTDAPALPNTTDTPTPDEGADDSSGGGLIPGFLQTLLFYGGILVAGVYIVLKGLAIYLGY